MDQNWNYEKDISGCAVIGILSEDGKRISGDRIIQSISSMHERSNGLGGGFAGYGIYPEYKDYYALHIMYMDEKIVNIIELLLEDRFKIELSEVIPHRHIPEIPKHPLIRRYFVKPKERFETTPGQIYEDLTDDEMVVRTVFQINRDYQEKGAFIFSSGKNMGIFKGVGYPEDIATFYRLNEYEAYCWTAHGRFPTNSQAWWGGAHPFGLLDISVIHNGEISSYGINKRYLENSGYQCTLGTDTEVIAYLWDLFYRKHKLDFHTAAKIMAAPFWSEIDRMTEEKKRYFTNLRMIYASALLNGPFAIIVGFKDGMFGLNDRLKLRPLVVAKENHTLYIASEESAINVAAEFRPLEKCWSTKGGELVLGKVKAP